MRFDVVLALYQRCSFRQLGQCESLRIVERASGLAPRFFMYIHNINIATANWGVVGIYF